jgi:uncharacterized protein
VIKVENKNTEDLKLQTDRSRQLFLATVKSLKKKKPDSLDKTVHDLHDEAFSHFNCLDCANCCKTIGPRLTVKDIEQLARHLKMKVSEFHTQFVEVDEDNDFIFHAHPCPFLLPDNYCSVYETRPRSCREYPHTDRKRFYQILDLSLKNCETCPVVFAIFRELS